MLALLAIVFAAAEVPGDAESLRYVHDARRRYQLLLVRRIVFWALVVAIVGFTFATELGSLATFAGLLTAGIAVAMQSVLVSIVGYFFLIGKYGIRVGDRVQIGNVMGEVIDLGLVRLHLLELSGQGSPPAPTGRVVAIREFGRLPGFGRHLQADSRRQPGVARPHARAACEGRPLRR